MRVVARNDNYPGHNKNLLERLNQQYGYAKDVKEYFDLKQIYERDFAGSFTRFQKTKRKHQKK